MPSRLRDIERYLSDHESDVSKDAEEGNEVSKILFSSANLKVL